MSQPIGVTFALLVLLGGCAAGPDYRQLTARQLQVPVQFQAMDVAGSSSKVDTARWWEAFGDPVLTGLVERSLAANLDIAQAGARLRQARASLRATRGSLYPQLGFNASASRSVINGDNDQTIYQAGFDAAYEVDIFGGTRRVIEAARADAQAAEASLRVTQIAIASEVALTYLDLRQAQARLAIARENLGALDETVQIVGWRVQAGLVSSLDQERARQLRAQTAANLPTLERTAIAAENRLAVLMGDTPGTIAAQLAGAAMVPLAPASSAIPAEVIRRRPDVMVAERKLAAETARIGVRTAELYPALRLTGSFGGSATNLADLADGAIGKLASSIVAPLFQGGQIRAGIAGQRAATDAALANYRQVVLVALEDTENALTAVSATERREREIALAEAAARNSALLARSQYRAGLIDFQALLDSERTLLSSQDARVTARTDRATAVVQLYKALGGGWEMAPMPQPSTDDDMARQQ